MQGNLIPEGGLQPKLILNKLQEPCRAAVAKDIKKTKMACEEATGNSKNEAKSFYMHLN